ncbi:MAG: rhomboid family intramembrane serine protease [Pseudomonadota bacterium]
MLDDAESGRFRRPPGPPAVVWGLTLVFVLFEAAFQISEATGWAGELRWTVYKELAFFDFIFDPELADIAVPVSYYATLATHAMLHGGPLHLLMNSAIFLALGGMLANGLGVARFYALFFGSAVGGALFFAAMSDAIGPLVGASGGIFGFFGALKRWELRWMNETGAPKRRLYSTIIVLVVINVLLAFAGPGEGDVAWEAHLGGFVFGWLLAPMVAPGRSAPSPI